MLLASVQQFGFVDPPGWPLNADDDGVVYHSVHRGNGDDRVAEIIAELFKVNVRCNDRGPFTVPAINHLVEQAGVFGVTLLQTVEADLVDEQDFRGQKELELLFERVVGQAGQEFPQHGGGGDIPAAVVVLTADEQQGFCQVTLPLM